jgi:purine-binding chemotaxis protein CheW
MEKSGKLSMEEEDLYDDDEDTQKDKYLTFRLAGEDYGIDVAFVTEIIGIQKITEVPDMPKCIKGVINLRGRVIPVMDIRLRFKLEEREYDDRTCIVVVDINNTAVGLVVDEVSDVVDIPSDQVEPPPSSGKGKTSRYLKGMGKIDDDVKILLNVDKLLFDEELETINEVKNETSL